MWTFWKKGNRTYTLIFCILLFLLSFILLYQIGHRPLVDYDEAIYAQVARESLEDNQIFTFQWLGNIGLDRPSLWAEKPPLMLWLIQVSYLIFGVNELGARIWVALFALGTVVVTFLFTKKLFESTSAGLLAIASFLVGYAFIEAAGTLQFDIPVGFFVLLTLYLFYLGLNTNPKYFYWFGITLALGMLTKNIVGLMPLAIIGFYSLFTLNFSYLKQKKFWLGVLLFLAVAIPWHLIETIKLGKSFWNQYLFYHLLKRFSEPLEGNVGNFWTYWNLIKEGRILFWLSIAGLVFFLVQAIRNKKQYLYVLLATLVIFLFFSASKTKLPAYILIIFPYLAILSGVTIDALLKKFFKPNSIFFKTGLLGIVLVFCYFGMRFNDYKLTKSEQRWLDNRSVGQYLKTEQTGLPLYYSSNIGTSPSIIFYSNRLVNHLKKPSPKPEDNFLLISDSKPGFEEAKPIFQTKTKSIYEIKNRP